MGSTTEVDEIGGRGIPGGSGFGNFTDDICCCSYESTKSDYQLSAEEHQAGKYFVSNATKSLHNLTHFLFNFN